MGEYTPKYGLYKPSIGEVNWGDDMNANIDKLEQILDTIEAKARSKLAELDDVDLTGVQDGHVLTYDASQGKWKPATIEAGGALRKVAEVTLGASAYEMTLTGLNIPNGKPFIILLLVGNIASDLNAYPVSMQINGVDPYITFMLDNVLNTNQTVLLDSLEYGDWVWYVLHCIQVLSKHVLINGCGFVFTDTSSSGKLLSVCGIFPFTDTPVDSITVKLGGEKIRAESTIKVYTIE